MSSRPPPAPAAAFITGGSSGIGLALARQLAEVGHALALFARDMEKLEAAQRSILDDFSSVDVRIYRLDVADAAACKKAVELAVSDLGPPQIAIASAGIAVPGLFLDQPASDHSRQMDVNYLGSLHFARCVTPPMIKNGDGALVFISSGAAFFGIHGYSSYAPSKFAVRGLAEVLRVELAAKGICVTLAYPPDTDTPQLLMEAETKPAATKAITAGGGLWSAEDVASKILRGVNKRHFVVAPGFQMSVLNWGHSFLAPLLRFYQARILKGFER